MTLPSRIAAPPRTKPGLFLEAEIRLVRCTSHQIMGIGTTTDDGWIALPGLFDASEVSGVTDLQVRAQPLVQVGQRILYGVYVRELANDGSEREISAVRSIAVVDELVRRRREVG